MRGAFATSEGRHTLAALGAACRLSVDLGPNEEVDVLLTIRPGSGCSLAVVKRGRIDDPAMQKTGDVVLITSGDAGAATPVIEPASPTAEP